MGKISGMLVSCGVALGLSAGTALGVPAVLERVPDDALLAVAIPEPEKFEKNFRDLAKAAGFEMPEMDLSQVLAMGGFSEGVDAKKAIAFIVLKPRDLKKPGKAPGEAAGDMEDDMFAMMDEIDQRTLALIPVSDYDKLLGNFGAKPAGDGKVDVITMPSGEDGYVKKLDGGYVVIGSERASIEAFTGKPGAVALKTRMGKAGDDVADGADIVTIFNMDVARPMAEEGLKDFLEHANEQMESMGQDQQKAQLETVKWVGEMVIRDLKMTTVGMKFSADGMSTDIVGNFNDKSYLHTLASAKGDSGSLLKKLPGGPFLVAFAMDTEDKAVKDFVGELYSRANGSKELEPVIAATKNFVQTTDASAMVMGFPMGGVMAGLMTNTVFYSKAKDEDKALAAFRESITAVNGKTMNEVKYTASYTNAKDNTKPDAPAYDVWDMKLAMGDDDEQTAQMMAQGMTMMFGPQGGPGGYAAKGNGGVYVTYAKSTELMKKALAAGGNDSLGGDELLKQVQDKLPSNRNGEAYIGIKGILDSVLPFAAMMGAPIAPDQIPEKLPPVGMSVVHRDGAARMTIHVPTPVIKTGVALGNAFSEMQNDMGGGMGDDPAGGNGSSPTGQPKF